MRGFGRIARTAALCVLGVSLGTTGMPAAHADPGKGPEVIAFTTLRNGPINWEIYSMKLGGQQETNLTNNPAPFDGEAAWAPGGTKLAFVTDRGGLFQIWTMNADGSGQTQLITDTCNNFDPAFSPDGTRIAFSRDCGGMAHIYVTSASGGGPGTQV